MRKKIPSYQGLIYFLSTVVEDQPKDAAALLKEIESDIEKIKKASNDKDIGINTRTLKRRWSLYVLGIKDFYGTAWETYNKPAFEKMLTDLNDLVSKKTYPEFEEARAILTGIRDQKILHPENFVYNEYLGKTLPGKDELMSRGKRKKLEDERLQAVEQLTEEDRKEYNQQIKIAGEQDSHGTLAALVQKTPSFRSAYFAAYPAAAVLEPREEKKGEGDKPKPTSPKT